MSQKRRSIKAIVKGYENCPGATPDMARKIKAGLEKFMGKPEEGDSMSKKYETELQTKESEFRAMVESFQGIGYGRMMEIISGIWYRKDSNGAFTVGECYGIEKLKRERCKKEGHDVRKGTNWNWCDRCGCMIDPDTGKEAQDC